MTDINVDSSLFVVASGLLKKYLVSYLVGLRDFCYGTHFLTCIRTYPMLFLRLMAKLYFVPSHISHGTYVSQGL